jgi:Protein of unknown function (DUF5663)
VISINDDLLRRLGLGGLPDPDRRLLCEQIYETLEHRVGERLADAMSSVQLDEFEVFFDARDDAGAFGWLELNFPNYKEIVQVEFDALQRQIKEETPLIIAAAAD